MQAFKGWIPAMVNFMCQTGWARCPDIGSNVILNVSVKVFCLFFFFMMLIFLVGELRVKHIALYNLGGLHPIHGRP